MDDYMFKANVDRCKNVSEATTYLELFSYSVSTQLSQERHEKLTTPGPKLQHSRGASADAGWIWELSQSQSMTCAIVRRCFRSWLVFRAHLLPRSSQMEWYSWRECDWCESFKNWTWCRAGHFPDLKLTSPSLQQNAQHPETFTPHVISLRPEVYRSMVVTLNLPYRAIESTSAVGPFFWAAWDQDEENPHLRIVPHSVLPSRPDD